MSLSARRQLAGGYELDDDRGRIDVREVHRYLSEDVYVLPEQRGRVRPVGPPDPHHRDVGPLGTDRWALGAVQVGPAELSERVGPALGPGRGVGTTPTPGFRVHHRLDRRDHHLPGLRIELSVDPDHPGGIPA